MRDFVAEIRDQTDFESRVKDAQGKGKTFVEAARDAEPAVAFVVSCPVLSPRTVIEFPDTYKLAKPLQHFIISSSAQNGNTYQHLFISQADGQWSIAEQIVRRSADGEETVVAERLDSDFPKGVVSWAGRPRVGPAVTGYARALGCVIKPRG